MFDPLYKTSEYSVSSSMGAEPLVSRCRAQEQIRMRWPGDGATNDAPQGLTVNQRFPSLEVSGQARNHGRHSRARVRSSSLPVSTIWKRRYHLACGVFRSPGTGSDRGP